MRALPGGLAGGRGPSRPWCAPPGGIWCDRQRFDTEHPGRGCWPEFVGPGRALDPARLRILSLDDLRGSSGPRAGEPFPSLSPYDQADALARVLDHLGVPSLRALVGGSSGGLVALAFAEFHPERVGSVRTISAADRAHPMALAWR